jgi:hypothetical protein
MNALAVCRGAVSMPSSRFGVQHDPSSPFARDSHGPCLRVLEEERVQGFRPGSGPEARRGALERAGFVVLKRPAVRRLALIGTLAALPVQEFSENRDNEVAVGLVGIAGGDVFRRSPRL